MAAVTHLVATASTSNTSSYASTSFTPTAGSLMVAYVGATDTVLAAPTLTSSANSITWTLVGSAHKINTSNSSQVGTLYAYVADQATPGSPSAMTVTFNCTGAAATGTVIAVGEVSGMSLAGIAAVRQSINVDDIQGGTAPATVFPAAALTGNPTVFGVLASVTGGTTPPTSWTELADVNYSTPSTCGGYSSRDSGFTGTTITLGSTSNGPSCAFAIELDASASGLSTGATVAETGTLTTAGTVGAQVGTARSSTATLTVAGLVGLLTSAAIAATGTVTTAGAVGAQTGASIAATGTIAAGGTVGGASPQAGASIAATETTTAAGAVGAQTGSSVAATDAITTAASVGAQTGAARAETATVTAAGVVGTSTGAALAATGTITTAGTVGAAGAAGATLAETDTITAAGAVGKQTGAAVAATDAVTAAGLVGKQTSASLAATATRTAAGTLGTATGATATFVVALSAAGTLAVAQSASLNSTATITAAGSVQGAAVTVPARILAAHLRIAGAHADLDTVHARGAARTLGAQADVDTVNTNGSVRLEDEKGTLR